MKPQFVLSDYIGQALAAASYEELADGTFTGRIPPCPGVIAFARTPADARRSSDLSSRTGFW